MATSDNQTNQIVMDQLGRPATDYELKKLSTASPQTLATLKDTYSKLNTTGSISDYLTFVGQDPSLQNRTTLGQQYGISNIGTAEGNLALLKALKSGPPAPTQPPAPVSGTIVPPTSDQPLTQEELAKINGMPGTVTDAANPPAPEQPPVLPEVSTLRDTYVSSQKSVLDVTSRINDINQSIDQALARKKAEVVQSGGIVDESQLRSIVLAENAPLLQERKDLLSQRQNLVGEQSIAGKAYQDALNRQKESDANFYKGQQLGLATKKEAAQESQFTAKQDLAVTKEQALESDKEIKNRQAQERINLAANKPVQLPIMDPAGNVIGKTIVTWHNPGATVGINDQGQVVKIQQDAQGNTTTTPVGTSTVPGVSSKVDMPKLTLAQGASPEAVLQSLTSGKDVYVKGSNIPFSQETLYRMAMDDIMGITQTTGGRTPSAAIAAVKDKRTDILKAYGISEPEANMIKTQLQSLGKTNAALLQTAAYNTLAANVGMDNLKLAIDASTKLPRGGAKLVNQWKQMADENFTPAVPLSELETYIYTFGREYAKVVSGSAQSKAGLTDSAATEVSKLLSAAQAPETFAAVAGAMQKDMQNVIDENNKATASYPDSVKKLMGIMGGGGTSGGQKQTPVTDVSAGSTITYQGKKYTVDAQGNMTAQ